MRVIFFSCLGEIYGLCGTSERRARFYNKLGANCQMASAARLSPHRVFGYYCRRVPAPIKENNNGDKKMNQAHGKWIVATLLGSIWLSGCGGGGGGGATITSSPTGVGYDGPTEPVAMSDQAAAEPIAAATIATAINLDLGTLPALQATDNAPSLLDLADITKGMIKRSQSLAATADGAALAGVTQSDTFDLWCQRHRYRYTDRGRSRCGDPRRYHHSGLQQLQRRLWLCDERQLRHGPPGLHR
jgi:hypothetical protein